MPRNKKKLRRLRRSEAKRKAIRNQDNHKRTKFRRYLALSTLAAGGIGGYSKYKYHSMKMGALQNDFSQIQSRYRSEMIHSFYSTLKRRSDKSGKDMVQNVVELLGLDLNDSSQVALVKKIQNRDFSDPQAVNLLIKMALKIYKTPEGAHMLAIATKYEKQAKEVLIQSQRENTPYKHAAIGATFGSGMIVVPMILYLVLKKAKEAVSRMSSKTEGAQT
jgi:hypothetical protein